MSGQRVDSGVETMWKEDDCNNDIHNFTLVDDEEIPDDVFEPSGGSPRDEDTVDGPATLADRRRKISVYSGVEMRGGQRDVMMPGSPGHYESQGLWSLSGHRYSAQGCSIIHQLRPIYAGAVSINLSSNVDAKPSPSSPPSAKGGRSTAEAPSPTAFTIVETPDDGGRERMVTLHSLGCGRDSGYVPSPSSANSFTFSSDEDEVKPSLATAVYEHGVTPPIAIPHTTRHRHSRYHASKETPHPAKNPLENSKRDTSEENSHKSRPVCDEWAPVRRLRTQSCPESVRPPVPPRTPVPRFPPTLTPSPNHSRNWSTPATTPDGKPILTPTPLPRHTTYRASRDAVIDLTAKEDRGCGRHRRQVLVLALPDLVVDTEGRATGSCTPPASIPTSNITSHLRVSMPTRNGNTTVRSGRPAWSRPRALSCDVTLEVALGQELRRIADNFDPVEEATRTTMWNRLRNSFRRPSVSSPPANVSGVIE